jgi:hypothetical protein
MLYLDNNSVTTFAGGNSSGSADGVGTAALLDGPWGIVYHWSGVLYMTEYNTPRVRRILVATARVTTVAIFSASAYYLCITNDGKFVYLTTYNTVERINTADDAVLTLAGNSPAAGFELH